MSAVLIGWGVFWLLAWGGLLVLGMADKDYKIAAVGLIGTALAAFWLIAVFIGRALA